MAKNRGLGNGLMSLMDPYADSYSAKEPETEIPIDRIQPDRSQPRQSFDEDSLNELAASIREHGIIQPLLVRPLADGTYIIVCGERRFRAAHKAELKSIPCVVRSMTDEEAMEITLVENLQREDLNPVEEALGYKKLMDEKGYTQEQIAKRVGKSRPVIANSIRLLSLPEDALELLKNGRISAGHAKAILSMENDSQKRSQVAKQIADGGLSVRAAEKLCRKKPTVITRHSAAKARSMTVPSIEKNIREVELSLKEALGVNVSVSYTKKNNSLFGTLSVEFYSEEQLKEFANKLGKK